MKVESTEHATPCQFAVSVPRRTFPKAVNRNPLRRRIREAYRLHKHLLYEQLTMSESTHLALLFIYTAKTPLPYKDIEGAIQKIIERLVKKLA